MNSNIFHAITHLKRVRNKVIALGECDSEKVYNCIMKCDNYGLLMNLKNTLENTRLFDIEKINLLSVVFKLSKLVDDCKPLSNNVTSKTTTVKSFADYLTCDENVKPQLGCVNTNFEI